MKESNNIHRHIERIVFFFPSYFIFKSKGWLVWRFWFCFIIVVVVAHKILDFGQRPPYLWFCTGWLMSDNFWSLWNVSHVIFHMYLINRIIFKFTQEFILFAINVFPFQIFKIQLLMYYDIIYKAIFTQRK